MFLVLVLLAFDGHFGTVRGRSHVSCPTALCSTAVRRRNERLVAAMASAASTVVQHTRPSWPGWVTTLRMAALCGFVGYVVWLVAGPHAPVLARDLFLYDTVVALLAVLLFVGSGVPGQRRGWVWLGVGLVAWLVADIVYTTIDVNAAGFPLVSDWLYLLFYPCACVGVWLLLRTWLPSRPWFVWADAIVVALASSAVAVAVFPSVFSLQALTSSAWVVSVANPGSDLVLLCLIAGAVSVTGWRSMSPSWVMLVMGFAVLWVEDMWWLVDSVNSDVYQLGSVLDALWLTAFVLVGFAPAFTPSRALVAAPVLMSMSAVPVVATAGSFLLIVVATVVPVSFAVVGLALAAVTVGVVRLLMSFYKVVRSSAVAGSQSSDPLTGLMSRSLFYERLASSCATASPGAPVPVLVLDVDRFGQVNETFGHGAGDWLLTLMADRVVKALRGNDVAARLGGDEFAVLLAPGTAAAEAELVARRVASALSAPFPLTREVGEDDGSDAVLVPGSAQWGAAHGLDEVTLSFSVGMAVSPRDGVSGEDVLTCAQVALARAKRLGGVAVYDSQVDGHDRDKVVVVEQLRSGIGSGELFCVFQPKLSIESNSVASVEALVRWRHPTRGVLSPAQFLPLAETSGLMDALTVQVLESALSAASGWVGQGLSVGVAVNVSVTNLLDEAFPDVVAAALERCGLAAALLTLEVTETVFVSSQFQMATALAVIERLHKLGVSISVDDYGTSFSSLAQVRDLGAAELKLDRSFVTGLATDSASRAVVASTSALAADLGLRLVAEGVESRADLLTLKQLGVPVAQGFFVCRPLEAAALHLWLDGHVSNGSAVLSAR